MSQCTQCEHNGYRYEFSTSVTSFNLSNQNCSSKGGILARYLDEDAHLALRKCCQNGFDYWIGLFENRSCSSSVVGPYSWVGDAACTSGSLLKVTELPNFDQSSQAVSILLNSNNLALPADAKERYENEKVRYICQYFSTVSTAHITASHAPTTSELTSTGTTFQQSDAKTITTSSTWPTTNGNKNQFHDISYSALIGTITGMVALICLLVGGLALHYYCKKRHSISHIKEITENQVTFKPSESYTQENEEPNTGSNHCNSPILTQVPTQDPSKDNDSGNYEDPNGYVTVNVHENETIAGKDPRMSKDEVQPYATFVAGPGHNYLSRDYCNILSFKECSSNQQDNYANVSTSATYVTLDNPDDERLSKETPVAKEDAASQYEVLMTPQDPNENEQTIYVKPFN